MTGFVVVSGCSWEVKGKTAAGEDANALLDGAGGMPPLDAPTTANVPSSGPSPNKEVNAFN